MSPHALPCRGWGQVWCRLWRRLWRRRADLPLLLEAAAGLGLAWAAMRLVPFGRLAAWLHPRVRRRASPPPAAAEVARVAWAVTVAARLVPWPAVCIHQGIVAQRLLARRGIPAELYYGVRSAPGTGDIPADILAHVWVRAGGLDVVGHEVAGDYVTLASFPSRP